MRVQSLLLSCHTQSMRVREWTISFVLLLRSVSTPSGDLTATTTTTTTLQLCIASLFCTKHDAFVFNSPFWNQMFKKMLIICIIFYRNTLNADVSKYYSTSITNPNFSSIYSHSKRLIYCRTPQLSKNTYSSNPTFKNSFGEKIFDLVVCTCGCVLNVFSAGVIPLRCCSFTEC